VNWDGIDGEPPTGAIPQYEGVQPARVNPEASSKSSKRISSAFAIPTIVETNAITNKNTINFFILSLLPPIKKPSYLLKGNSAFDLRQSASTLPL
jgi:hypothetical protein